MISIFLCSLFVALFNPIYSESTGNLDVLINITTIDTEKYVNAVLEIARPMLELMPINDEETSVSIENGTFSLNYTTHVLGNFSSMEYAGNGTYEIEDENRLTVESDIQYTQLTMNVSLELAAEDAVISGSAIIQLADLKYVGLWGFEVQEEEIVYTSQSIGVYGFTDKSVTLNIENVSEEVLDEIQTVLQEDENIPIFNDLIGYTNEVLYEYSANVTLEDYIS